MPWGKRRVFADTAWTPGPYHRNGHAIMWQYVAWQAPINVKETTCSSMLIWQWKWYQHLQHAYRLSIFSSKQQWLLATTGDESAGCCSHLQRLSFRLASWHPSCSKGKEEITFQSFHLMCILCTFKKMLYIYTHIMYMNSMCLWVCLIIPSCA